MSVVGRAPGPKGHLLSGNLPEYARNPLGFLTECFHTYGDVVRLRFMHVPVYLVSHPDLVESVLLSHRESLVKGRARRTSRRVFGNGLLTSEGESWLRQRRLLQPAFQYKHTEGYGERVVSSVQVMLASWADGQRRNICQEMSRLTLDVLSRTLVQAELTSRADLIHMALEVLLDHFADLRPVNVLLPDWFPTLSTLRARRAVRQLEQIIYAMIRERRADGNNADDLFSLLLAGHDASEDQTNGRQLRDQLMTLLLAGHETTAVALSWTWYLLSEHPAIEARLVRELRDVLGGRLPTPADLPRLPYVEAVVLESMRLYPPIYAFGRQALRDCRIGECSVPAGSSLFISQWIMHRDSRYFNAPEEFNPDRWINGSAKQSAKYSYLPFGVGPRQCIGASFAMTEIVLLVAAIAQKFRLALLPGQMVEPQASITLRPKHGIWVVLSRRAAANDG